MYFFIGLLVNNEKRYKIITSIISITPKRMGYFVCNIISSAITIIMKITKHDIRIKREFQGANQNFWQYFNLRKYIKHLAYMFYEVITDKYKQTSYLVKGEEYIANSLKKGKGCILFSAHMGNFVSFGTYILKKYNCLVVVTGGSKELNPLYVYYKEMNYNLIDYDNENPIMLVKKIKKQLDNNGLILLMGDFYRPNFKDSILFGIKSKSPYGTAYISIKNRTDIIPCYSIRSPKKDMIITFEKPIALYELFSEDKKMEATNYLNCYIEDMILAEVNQWYYWFEIHQRFHEERILLERAVSE